MPSVFIFIPFLSEYECNIITLHICFKAGNSQRLLFGIWNMGWKCLVGSINLLDWNIYLWFNI